MTTFWSLTFLMTMMSIAVIVCGKTGDMNPHPPFNEETGLWQVIGTEPIEHQVMQITGSIYDELITSPFSGSPINPSQPWVLLFANPD